MLDREVFNTLLEVQVLTEQYRQTYNRVRPHSSLSYRPPAPETILPEDIIRELVTVTWRVVQLLGGRSLICLVKQVKQVQTHMVPTREHETSVSCPHTLFCNRVA